MRTSLPYRSLPFLVLVASAALAGEREHLGVRTLLLSEQPDTATHRVYVKGRVVSVLRFEQPVDPARTKLLGWEGRFEPLGVVGQKVILEPLRDLDSDEGVPLMVTLASGMEVPFLLRPSSEDEGRRTDQQVNVFKDPESYEALFSALTDTRKANSLLREENERLRKEETSEDHALAALLASGAVGQTPFTIADFFSGKDDTTQINATVFQGKGKAAVVYKVQNLAPKQSWGVKSVRLTSISSGRERSVAMRATHSFIAPGTSGVVAIIADKSAFMDDGKLTSLFLEVYRNDGYRQSLVQLDPYLVGE